MTDNKKYTVVITRAEHQAPSFDQALHKRGFNTLLIPSLEIKPAKFDDSIAEIFSKLDSNYFNWLVFSSANGVASFHSLQNAYLKSKSIKNEAKAFPALKIAAQGTETAKVYFKLYKRSPDFVPSIAVAEAFVAEFDETELRSAKILLAIAAKTRGVLGVGLADMGALVTELVVYDTVARSISPDTLRVLDNLPPQRIVFTFFSPSAAQSIYNAMAGREELLRRARIVSIGPVTSKALRDLGLKVDYEARDHSEEGVLKELEKLE